MLGERRERRGNYFSWILRNMSHPHNSEMVDEWIGAIEIKSCVFRSGMVGTGMGVSVFGVSYSVI